MYLTLMMKNDKLLRMVSLLCSTGNKEQRREAIHKSRSFSIIKVGYIILRNFFAIEPISIIFDDYES